MVGYHYGFNAPSEFALTSEECEKIGGHCWRDSDVTLTSNPPQYPQWCRHCGATRVRIPQEPYTYSEPVPRKEEDV